jgi:hypothetical protein
MRGYWGIVIGPSLLGPQVLVLVKTLGAGALVIGPSGSCIGQDSRGWSAAYQPEPHKTSRIHVLLGLDPLGYMY